eukprot:TRINITY_DN29546_c0_g1_i1.p1 TRINITY_DN29546_c0_g1~~TRINITY_DN29546_c0_g1_i1.p1  ORF type:complete len:319 (+),score=47.69 TRINITY_DN29546_c0_g1_i1:163-1119(+)
MAVAWLCDIVRPCFDCDGGENYTKAVASGRHRSALSARVGRSRNLPGQTVELAVSPLAGLRGAAGYHTSLLVAGEEWYFSPAGINVARKLVSHEASGLPYLRRYRVGTSQHGSEEMFDYLMEHFPAGSYDFLRKNCNSFTDCALFFLCSVRLDSRFRRLEQLGAFADSSLGLVQVVSNGEYRPNPRADDFDLEALIEEMRLEREIVEMASSCERPEASAAGEETWRARESSLSPSRSRSNGCQSPVKKYAYSPLMTGTPTPDRSWSLDGRQDTMFHSPPATFGDKLNMMSLGLRVDERYFAPVQDANSNSGELWLDPL